MITLEDLRKIAKREWGNMNPAQRLVIIKELNNIAPNDHNQALLKKAEADYAKWDKNISYNIIYE